MGKFIYGVPPATVDIDDRVLAHLRMVMVTKLRRSEPFMFEFDLPASEGSGRRSFWVHPAVPMQFHFFGNREPRLNRAWIEELIREASGPMGLRIVPEPDDARASTPVSRATGRESLAPR
jgi:hypothetical protein